MSHGKLTFALIIALTTLTVTRAAWAEKPAAPYTPTDPKDIEALMTAVDLSGKALGYEDLKKVAYLTGHTFAVLDAMAGVLAANINPDKQVKGDNKKLYDELGKTMNEYEAKTKALTKELEAMAKDDTTTSKAYVDKLLIIQALQLEALRLEIEMLQLYE